MRLTNNTAIKLLRRAKCSELDESIRTYPEDERGDKTDIEILRDEIYYLIEMYEEGGTRLSEDLEEARDILRETNNGRCNKLTKDFDLVYSEFDIRRARSTVNEYKRLKRLVKEI